MDDNFGQYVEQRVKVVKTLEKDGCLAVRCYPPYFDEQEAERLDTQLMPLYEALAYETNPIPVKWAVYELQLAGPHVRLPLAPLKEAFREPLRDVLKKLGRVQASLDSYRAALEIFRQLELFEQQASGLNNVGLAYQTLGDTERA